jgi:hypothetical protein
MNSIKAKITVVLILSLSIISCSKNEQEPIQKSIDLNTTITCQLLNQTTSFNGILEIKGIIKNIGNSDFSSGLNQPKAYLILKAQAGSEIILEELDFNSLSKDNELTISHQRTWLTSTEFPPSFIVRIVYDPDILSDGNDNNDDTNTSNNSNQLLPNVINDLF